MNLTYVEHSVKFLEVVSLALVAEDNPCCLGDILFCVFDTEDEESFTWDLANHWVYVDRLDRAGFLYPDSLTLVVQAGGHGIVQGDILRHSTEECSKQREKAAQEKA